MEFPQRISLLRSIHDDSVEYCNKYKINKTIKTTRTAEDTFTSMEAYVWSIGRRAMRSWLTPDTRQAADDTTIP